MKEITFNQVVRYYKEGKKVYVKVVNTGDFFSGTYLVPLDEHVRTSLDGFLVAEYFVKEEDLDAINSTQ